MPMDHRTMKPGGKIRYLLRDDFNDAPLAAGSVNGTPALPGPGTRTVVDTENKISISSGQLQIAGGKAAPAIDDPAYSLTASAITTTVGLTALFKFTNVSGRLNTLGWTWGVSTGQNAATFRYISSKIYASSSVGNVENGTITPGLSYKVAVICRPGIGGFVLIKGGTEFLEWTMLTPVYYNLSTAWLQIDTYDGANSIDYMRTIQLPAPFNTDYGLATDREAGAVVTGTTFAHEANGIIVWTQTALPTADSTMVFFRYQDAGNYWYVNIATDGSLTLYEVVATSATSRGTGAAGSIAAGQGMIIICDGTTIKVYANRALKITYTSAANFATAKVGELEALGTDGAVSDIVTYPRTIASTILTEASR